eukprot:gi/632986560/ref/XP_007910307.1/ PREDICTED: uncharacterized protein LOC103191156 [Callorhinchus milii]
MCEKPEDVWELRPVAFHDGVLWLEAQETSDLVPDCVEKNKEQALILQNSELQVLTVWQETADEIEGEFRYLNRRQINAGEATFRLVSYKEAECSQNCGVTYANFPVSFVVDVDSKTYMVSCSKSNIIEFKEASVPQRIDGSQKHVVFYRRTVGSKYMRYESVLRPGWFLCTEKDGELHRLTLKHVSLDTHETVMFLNISK